MRTFSILLILSAIAPLAGQTPTANEILVRSLRGDMMSWGEARDYTMVQTTIDRKLDGKGEVVSTETKKHDVMILFGEPYERLIERDGKQLSPTDNRKEEKKLAETSAKREREGPEKRQRRLDKKKQENARHSRAMRDIPDAFVLSLVGEENLAGRSAYVIKAEPRKDYRPQNGGPDWLNKFRGKIWIDKAEYRWLKADAETTDTVSFGWFLARLAPGTRVMFEQARVNNEVWLPTHFLVRYDIRLALVRRERAEMEKQFSNFRKFQSDSRIVSVGTGSSAP